MATNKFIGSGILFPIEINESGRPDYVNDNRLIVASILQILNTPKNIRYFNENFGCRIEELLDEPNDGVANTLLRAFIVESLTTYEPRIILDSINIVNYDLFKVNVRLTYTITNTKQEESMIFPYYKQAA
jgi:hypothetical protein